MSVGVSVGVSEELVVSSCNVLCYNTTINIKGLTNQQLKYYKKLLQMARGEK